MASENENSGISKVESDNSLMPNELGIKKKTKPIIPVNDQMEIASVILKEFNGTTISAT